MPITKVSINPATIYNMLHYSFAKSTTNVQGQKESVYLNKLPIFIAAVKLLRWKTFLLFHCRKLLYSLAAKLARALENTTYNQKLLNCTIVGKSKFLVDNCADMLK